MQLNSFSPQQAYQRQGIMTASPAELIIMLYDGCIKNMKLAVISYESGDIDATNRCLIKAQAIIEELVNSLDPNIELSEQLFSIYEYLLTELASINVRKELERISDLVEIMIELRDTWREVAATTKNHIIVETAK